MQQQRKPFLTNFVSDSRAFMVLTSINTLCFGVVYTYYTQFEAT